MKERSPPPNLPPFNSFLRFARLGSPWCSALCHNGSSSALPGISHTDCTFWSPPLKRKLDPGKLLPQASHSPLCPRLPPSSPASCSTAKLQKSTFLIQFNAYHDELYSELRGLVNSARRLSLRPLTVQVQLEAAARGKV